MTSVLFDPAIEQVTQADRLPRQDLATVLAHELRNPLAPIAAAAEILLRQSPNEQVRQLGCIIERNADQLRRLIDDLVQTTSASASPLSFFSPTLDPPEADAQCFVQHVLPFEADGRALPDWLKFVPGERRFVGTAPPNVGQVSVVVTARDERGEQVSTSITLNFGN